ncbi:DUF1643 domain-containing protein [Paracoccus marinaquae]|uniref:DUF1643 domain-containing protein n=1 Tax=Paracoccus marinaquae TaxID=2841926 RepID=A0ABS6AG52_9RHOB|nr:DUF1643 domain-containing protein [Paracoccus marinaquae]MBU3028660.1 DUF1643 domain-containing protein [Paracoccus marinaquae]
MIIRSHQDDRARSTAVYSECGAYRYALTREWGKGARLLFVMLNPSTADERRNDPTIERCERRARAMGCGAMRIANIFAFRATDPRVLTSAPAPVGPANDAVLAGAADWADDVLCAWGVHGTHLGRGAEVEAMLRQDNHRLWHLGLTRAGMPRHPLYIGYAILPCRWY